MVVGSDLTDRYYRTILPVKKKVEHKIRKPANGVGVKCISVAISRF